MPWRPPNLSRSQKVMAACCPTGPGLGHRRMQTQCKLPDTCGSLNCATEFVSFFDECSTVQSTANFKRFYANCKELQTQSQRMLLEPVSVQMFKVAIATKPPPPPPKHHSSQKPPPSSSDVKEYHAVCNSAAISHCVPTCNATHHGYELLATIDGMDTKFSCNVAHALYSWVGAASEGGYLGADVQSFFSAVVSSASGSYLLTLTKDAKIRSRLTVRPGQKVSINGDKSGKYLP